MNTLNRAALVLAALAPFATTQDSRTHSAPRRELRYETGKVTVQGGKATIDLPDGFRYLQASDARYVVEILWGNGSRPFVLGLVVPDGEDVQRDDSWAIVVTYDDSGHIDDSDAKGLDYAAILEEMKTSVREESAEGKKHKRPGLELLGWAEPPHYDSAQKKLYWAKTLRFEGVDEPTLNYCIRFLGRSGVLEMIAVGSDRQLAKIAEGSKQVIPRTEFTTGNRYEEYQPGIDKAAGYGIAALIGGAVLAKAGFFKVIGLFLVKFAKPLIIGLVALVAVVGRALGVKRKGAAQAGGRKDL